MSRDTHNGDGEGEKKWGEILRLIIMKPNLPNHLVQQPFVNGQHILQIQPFLLPLFASGHLRLQPPHRLGVHRILGLAREHQRHECMEPPIPRRRARRSQPLAPHRVNCRPVGRTAGETHLLGDRVHLFPVRGGRDGNYARRRVRRLAGWFARGATRLAGYFCLHLCLFYFFLRDLLGFYLARRRGEGIRRCRRTLALVGSRCLGCRRRNTSYRTAAQP